MPDVKKFTPRVREEFLARLSKELNGGLGYIVIPFGDISVVNANGMQSSASGTAKGLSGTLSAGLGLRL